MKIGYGGYSDTLIVPGDRRRFCAYAKVRNIEYEYAKYNKDYDLVYLTYNSDLSYWIAQKQILGDKIKVIFEIIDSYLAEPKSLKSRLRGATRYLLGTNSRMTYDFTSVIKKMCQVADAVVCSTLEQKKDIQRFNNNVHVSFDFFDSEIKTLKEEINQGERLKLVWEGQPYTLNNINVIKSALNALKDEVELHIVTDITYFKYFKKYFKSKTEDILKDIECKKVFHAWEKDTFHKHITDCDLAIIPIDLEDSFQRGKPENKLVLLWKMGMPVITSKSPAYERCMALGKIDMIANNTHEDWVENIRSYKARSMSAKISHQEQVKEYVESKYNSNILFDSWDQVINSVLT